MRPIVKRPLTAVAALVLAAALGSCAGSGTPAPTVAPTGGNVEATSPGPATAPRCGVERWAVKTGTDPAAPQVDLATVHDTNVPTLAGLPVPAGIDEHPDVRQGAELSVWRVHAILVEYKMEDDSDYHLVLRDAATGKTMIAEIPAPACVADSSPFRDAITHARKQFDQVFTADGQWHPAGVPVVVTGVGFFDRLHGQTGVAPNGIELHPVLDIQIGNPDSSPSPVPSPASLRAVELRALITGTSPNRLKACFDNRGVEFGSFAAWLCEHKLGGDPSGSLYFALSVDDGLNRANPAGQMMWSKLHAAHGAFYVWENYSEPWGGDYPRNNGRIIALDEGKYGQCVLDWPSWTTDPQGIRCFADGGHTVTPERPLTPAEQYSVHEYQVNARATLPLGYR